MWCGKQHSLQAHNNTISFVNHISEIETTKVHLQINSFHEDNQMGIMLHFFFTIVFEGIYPFSKNSAVGLTNSSIITMITRW